MANAQTEKTQAKNPAPVAEPNGANQEEDDGWAEIATDIPLYVTDKCDKVPVVGYLLSLDQMPESDNGPWKAYRILTTKAGKACDFEKNVIDTIPGDEVRVTKTVKLAALDRFLLPDAMVEVSITPKTLRGIGGGHKMWEYDVKANKKSIKRRPGIYALGPVSNVTPASRQLGNGNGNSDIPF